jgi:tRNA threonylcarbamoyladenosine biosynthesis protein TsaE
VYARNVPVATDDLVVVTNDPAETRSLGARLGAVARAGDVLAVSGDLGAGKTELAKGFGAGLGVAETVASPSFVLMAEHAGRLRFFHLDLYRLDGPDAAIGAGLLDEREEEGVTLIEWAERLGDELPPARLDVAIAIEGDACRRIHLRATDPGLRRYLDAVRRAGSADR